MATPPTKTGRSGVEGKENTAGIGREIKLVKACEHPCFPVSCEHKKQIQTQVWRIVCVCALTVLCRSTAGGAGGNGFLGNFQYAKQCHACVGRLVAR